jgi:PTS system galactitol-specific IIC component
MDSKWIQDILNWGPNVLLPVIMFVLGLAIGMKPGRALGAGLLLGVAFTGMFTFFGLAFDALPKAGQAIVERFPGLTFTAYDFGWVVAATISWAWPFAAFMFPLQIVINIIMLALGWTKCLNVDMWNVWHKATLGAFTSAVVSGGNFNDPLGLTIGFIVAGAWVVMELLSADYTREQVYNLTKIPGIAVSHNMLLDALWMAPIMDVLDRIPFLRNIRTSPADLRRRLGVIGENYILGAILGLVFGLMAGYNAQGIATLVIQCATVVTLFPLIAGLFARALAPVAEAAQEFMARRFPGREFYIGLDWPVLAGIDAMWVTGIIVAPFALLIAIGMSALGLNTTLPFASIIVVSLIVTTTVLAQGDIVKSVILSIIGLPVYLYAASFFAPYFTQLAQATGVFSQLQIPPEILQSYAGLANITWLEMNAAGFRLMVFSILAMFQGQLFPGVLSIVVIPLCWWYYFRTMKARENAAAAASGGIAGNTRPYPDAPAGVVATGAAD